MAIGHLLKKYKCVEDLTIGTSSLNGYGIDHLKYSIV
jgi:hypothetical protein